MPEERTPARHRRASNKRTRRGLDVPGRSRPSQHRMARAIQPYERTYEQARIAWPWLNQRRQTRLDTEKLPRAPPRVHWAIIRSQSEKNLQPTYRVLGGSLSSVPTGGGGQMPGEKPPPPDPKSSLRFAAPRWRRAAYKQGRIDSEFEQRRDRAVASGFG